MRLFLADQRRLLNAYQLLGLRYEIYHDENFFRWQRDRLQQLNFADWNELAQFPLQVILARDYLEYKSVTAGNAAAFQATVQTIARDPAIAAHAPAAMSGYTVAAIWLGAWAFGVVNGAFINGFFANALTNFAAPLFDPTFQYLKKRGTQIFGDRAAVYANWLNRERNAQTVLENGPSIQAELDDLAQRASSARLGRVGVTPEDFVNIRRMLREGWIPMLTALGKSMAQNELAGRAIVAEAGYLRKGWLDQLITNFQNKEMLNQVAIRQILQGWQSYFPGRLLELDTIVENIKRIQAESVIAMRNGRLENNNLFQNQIDEQIKKLVEIGRANVSVERANEVEELLRRQVAELMSNNLLRLEAGRQVIGAMVAKYMDMLLYPEYDLNLAPQVDNWVRTMQGFLGPEYVASAYNAEVSEALRQMGLTVQGIVQDADFVLQSTAHRNPSSSIRRAPVGPGLPPSDSCFRGFGRIVPLLVRNYF